ncbi:hypothetical protein VTL71DRAFT_473 [Oculimacula yallundae]|uniref:Uncharacterized protein n=1 Tax=Oculimacula yallundae TaxID=86028 RepID=A0ABR4D099_9HELO
MAPGPFCCYDAIPSTVRYLTTLLPSTTIYNPLTKSKRSAPFLTSFLVHLITTKLPLSTSTPEGTSPLFYAIVQVKKIHAPEPPKDEVKEKNTPKTAPSSASSSISIISTPATGPGRYSNTMASPYTTATPAPVAVALAKDIPRKPLNLPEEHYFVPIEKSNSPTALSEISLLFGRGWREITVQEAMESLRFPGLGIMIGDGEVWTQKEGVEKFWCETHGVWFEMRVWVRESAF